MALSPTDIHIQLDPKEEQILNLIHAFTVHLRDTRDDLPKVECRVAGGWVRDKLLGLACEDLDICISSLTGHHFATLLEEYLALLRSRNDEQSALLTSTKIAKIQANPDQSKHLETAKMHVLGIEMDFVQLRSEEYADGQGNSRIPTSVKFGTPLEDALRRDITINALFYNVHSRGIEDWTEKGLPDLLSSHPLIRTPLEPLQTFLDDPLRIMRCIRFAGRFGFPLHDSIKPAVSDERVRHALTTKVSKERIGVELDKTLKGPNPLLALKLIDHLSLYSLIFSPLPPATPSSSVPPDASRQAILSGEILEALLQRASQNDEVARLLAPLQDKLVRKRLWLALALHPLRGITYMEKKKELPVTDSVIKDSVKLPTHEKLFVQHVHSAADKLSHPRLVKFLKNGAGKERSSIGLLLREGDVHDVVNGLEWRTSVLFSLIMDLLPVWGKDQQAVVDVLQTYTSFVGRIEELQLDIRAFEKSRLDGNEVSTVLQAKPGRLMSGLIARVIEWQLDNPEGSKEACGAMLKQEWEQGNFGSSNAGTKGEISKKGQSGAGSSTEDGGVKPAKKKRKESI